MEFKELIRLMEVMSASNLDSLEYENGSEKVHLTNRAAAVGKQEAEIIPVPMVQEEPGNTVSAPLVGTFYSAPAEGAEPFVSVGDRVKKGQVLGIIEAMKLMNEIESEYDGEVVQVLAENKTAVEYGQPLFVIR